MTTPNSIWGLLPRPLKIILAGGVAVAIYGIFTWALGIHSGLGPGQLWVKAYGVPLPYLNPTATASVLLALGTAALAYAAIRQALAAEALAESAEGQEVAAKNAAAAADAQARAMDSQIAVLQGQLEIIREHSRTARADAERADAIRRATSFPRVNVVTVLGFIDRKPVSLIPGNAYTVWGNPTLGIQNIGKGQASDLRIAGSWKVYGFDQAKSIGTVELAALAWERVPQWIPPLDILDCGETDWVDSSRWLSQFDVGNLRTKRIVGLFVKVSWTDPDGIRKGGVVGGLLLIPGSYSRSEDAPGQETSTFLALAPQDAPPDAAFSDEPPLP